MGDVLIHTPDGANASRGGAARQEAWQDGMVAAPSSENTVYSTQCWVCVDVGCYNTRAHDHTASLLLAHFELSERVAQAFLPHSVGRQ